MRQRETKENSLPLVECLNNRGGKGRKQKILTVYILGEIKREVLVVEFHNR